MTKCYLTVFKQTRVGVKKMSIDKKYFSLTLLDYFGEPVKMLEPQVYALRDGQEYLIKLGNNHRKRRANAKIFIDGKEVLYVRLKPWASEIYERPISICSKFTFCKPSGTASSFTNPDRGTIRVEFALEKRPIHCFRIRDSDEDETDGPASETTTRGETRFRGHSYQKFHGAAYMETEPSTVIRAIMTLDTSELTAAEIREENRKKDMY